MTAARTLPTILSALHVNGASIHLHQVSVNYGEKTVLHDLNLDIAPAERVAVIGASGGGKTTLLRVLAGLTPASHGSVQIRQVNEAARVRVMFQEDRLLPWLGALDNVTLGLPRQARFFGSQALGDVGLGHRPGAYPHELSGGQRQRVALARALAHRPALLLLDEPFGALDALTRASMHDLLETLLDETGATTLLVTHDLDEALKLADRVLLLADGHIVEDLRVTVGRPRVRGELEPLREQLEGKLH